MSMCDGEHRPEGCVPGQYVGQAQTHRCVVRLRRSSIARACSPKPQSRSWFQKTTIREGYAVRTWRMRAFNTPFSFTWSCSSPALECTSAVRTRFSVIVSRCCHTCRSTGRGRCRCRRRRRRRRRPNNKWGSGFKLHPRSVLTIPHAHTFFPRTNTATHVQAKASTL